MVPVDSSERTHRRPCRQRTRWRRGGPWRPRWARARRPALRIGSVGSAGSEGQGGGCEVSVRGSVHADPRTPNRARAGCARARQGLVSRAHQALTLTALGAGAAPATSAAAALALLATGAEWATTLAAPALRSTATPREAAAWREAILIGRGEFLSSRARKEGLIGGDAKGEGQSAGARGICGRFAADRRRDRAHEAASRIGAGKALRRKGGTRQREPNTKHTSSCAKRARAYAREGGTGGAKQRNSERNE